MSSAHQHQQHQDHDDDHVIYRRPSNTDSDFQAKFGRCRQQYGSLMKKEFILRRRQIRATIMEMIIPTLIIALVALLRSVIDQTSQPDELNLGYKFTYNFNDNRWVTPLIPNGQMIAFIPDNTITRSLASSFESIHSDIFNSSSYQWASYFTDESSFSDYIKSDGYPDQRGRIAFGIVINTWDTMNNQYSYSLRFNSSGDDAGTPLTSRITSDFSMKVTMTNINTFREWGFLDWQHFIDQTILNMTLTNGNTSLPVSSLDATTFDITPMPTYAHTDDTFATVLSNLVGFIYALAYISTVTKLVTSLVSEKEMRIKEGMKMMGLSETAHFLSHATTALLQSIGLAFSATMMTLKVYEHSTKGYVFVYFWLYNLNIFCFCYLMSTFFSKARTASTFTTIVYLGFFMISFGITDDTSSSAKGFASLFFPVAMALGAQVFANFEMVGGINSDTVNSSYQGYTVNKALGMMVLDCFLYLALAFYFNQVMPNDTGVSQKWYFCFTKRYWRPSRAVIDDHSDDAIPVGEFLETAPSHLKAGVKIRNLRKEFAVADKKKNFVAVENLNLDLYEGQILSLLGHNGAGKTTTISMLTGLTPITSGDATINGLSLQQSLEVIRPSLGVCPQHDILFDLLTVSEHLTMYAAIKGIPSADIPAAVTEMIALVGLIEKTNTQSASLSGGQKRKLSVGIALLGDSKVVFLDEPTSGMDPYSRRWTWNLLKQRKKGRVIVLTTHFMDEADYLGDRIAIMAKGKIQCCGSSLFLKSKYGVGYTFTVSKTADCNTDVLTRAITDRVPHAEVLSNAGTEISYQLPLAAADTFPAMFDELDTNGKSFGMESYGISVTTLEEVFLRVGHAADHDNGDDSDDEKKNGDNNGSDHASTKINMNGNSDDDMLPPQSRPEPATWGRQVRALLIKRWQHTKRDKKSLMWQIGYPVLILIFGILLLKIAGAAREQDSLLLSLQQYGGVTPVPLSWSPVDVTDQAGAAAYLTPQTSYQSMTPVAMSSNNVTTFAEYLVHTALTSGVNRYGAIYINGPSLAGSAPLSDERYTVYINTTAMHALPTYINLLNTARLQHACTALGRSSTPSAPRITVYNHPLPPTAKASALIDSSAGLMIGIAFAYVPAAIVGWIVKERQTKVKHLQIISGVSTKAYWISTWIWDCCSFIIPSIVALIVFAIFSLDGLIGSNSIAVILAMCFYATSITAFTYVCSFLFQNHASAQNNMLLVYIMTGSIFSTVVSVLVLVDSTRSTGNALRWIFRFLPNYCFCEIITNLLTRESPLIWGSELGTWDMKITGAPILYMFFESIIYFALLMMIEKVLASPDMVAKVFSTPTLSDKDIATETIMDAEEDPDIKEERKRVMDQARSGNTLDMISIQGMRKVYNGRFGAKAKCAVKNLYFGVPEGQCFGFLGINGAGKTTTLRMLSGDELPSKGTSYLNGLDIMTEQEAVRRLIGYCPQFDALIDTLTSREHLALFARIKGVPEAEIPRLVNELLDKLTLTQYADRPCGGYSGGNKRKLCVGLSLIGHPPIVFLDEPSTGMDPGSRRFMWNLISSTMKGRSVILTTHSMEECEALCQRIGIMVSGRLKCIGSANHLRQRYGHGYQLDLNVPVDRVPYVKEFIKSTFAGSHVLEHHDSNIKFRLRKDRSLGTIFRIMNDNRSTLGITEYSVSEATLEQIFIRFARMQEEELAQAEGLSDTTLLNLDGDLSTPKNGTISGQPTPRRHDMDEKQLLHVGPPVTQAQVFTNSGNGHIAIGITPSQPITQPEVEVASVSLVD